MKKIENWEDEGERGKEEELKSEAMKRLDKMIEEGKDGGKKRSK